MANIFYNRVIRKIIVGFGNIFDNITLVRYNPDESEAERFILPIAYSTKERYVMRLEEDPVLDKRVQTTLPRLAFEMNGISYDASRKLNTNIKNFATNSTGAVVGQYNPVPYDFDFSLYLYVRNIEDGTQVIEHILPYFTPDYTIKLNLIPEMGIVKEIPVILNKTDYEVIYEGPEQNDTRTIIWTLNFTVKGYIFGPVSPANLIKNSITNIYNAISPTDTVIFNLDTPGVGTYQEGELVFQGYSLNTAISTARVKLFTNNQIHLTNIQGNFVSNQPIIGAKTNANYTFNSYQIAPINLAQIVVTPTPTDANTNTDYGYTSTITEVPNINTTVVTPTDFSGDLSVQFGTDNLATEKENPIDLN